MLYSIKKVDNIRNGNSVGNRLLKKLIELSKTEDITKLGFVNVIKVITKSIINNVKYINLLIIIIPNRAII